MYTLLLNADYNPIQAISWKKAICLWMDNKAEIVEEYADIDINSVSFTMKCPAVIKLTSYKKYFNKSNKVKFSRYNIFYRDGFSCQYCAKQYDPRQLTFDHIVPKFHGGKSEWTNIVSSCYPCNSKKGNKLLAETDMKLLSNPKEPKFADISRYRSLHYKTPDIWKNYIQ